MPRLELVYALSEIDAVAQKFWQMSTGTVFAFHGQMGAGKTTFITALCKQKGITGHLGSPTFSLINEYAYTQNGSEQLIYHMDMYRLKDEEEAVLAGVEDSLYSGNICFVEWPEKIPGILPEDTVQVYINVVDAATRSLKLEAN